MNADAIRDSFVSTFSEEQAAKIEEAARQHVHGAWGIGHGNDDQGSSPFRYWLLAAISYECVGRYANDHGITVPEDELRDWAITHGDLGGHDGDAPDYLGLIAGAYDGWLS